MDSQRGVLHGTGTPSVKEHNRGTVRRLLAPSEDDANVMSALQSAVGVGMAASRRVGTPPAGLARSNIVHAGHRGGLNH